MIRIDGLRDLPWLPGFVFTGSKKFSTLERVDPERYYRKS